MFERAALARILPFGIYIAFILIADVLAWLGCDGQQLRHLYAVKIAAVVAALLYFRRDYDELAGPAPGAAALLGAAGAGALVFVLWIELDAAWMVLGAADGYDPRRAGAVDWWLAGSRLAGAALVVPLMEELFWRSFLMRSGTAVDFRQVDPRTVKFQVVIVEVILFGIEHNLWFAGVIAGTVYSALYMRQRSLWTAVAAHGVTNGLLGAWVLHTGSWRYW
ncbi:CAAX prenyl protease-related protein [Rugamonas sp. DEMB1]|uniref:CAAX prenyl protease-related protein n=1 Tax=Rugamonas sp. DEMB1 TaxID=3039386 RepID=UPI00244AF83D|nr:CAAX prenyl protease-related protein [Rugamonas sp. DEMB1]WGG49151.1 CAAX prenyl protease-related protein [Rugamonas sp. DEMB1]